MTVREPEQGRPAHTHPPGLGDDQGWMAMFSTLDDDAVDALLAGQPPADGDLAPVAEVAAALRRSRATEPVPPIGPALRAQLEARPMIVPFAARSGRGALVRAAAVAAAAGVVVVGLGFGAAQNRLPTALQDVVSSTAELVGIDVPTTRDRPSGPADHGRSDTVRDEGIAGEDGSTGADGSSARDDKGIGATPADPGTPGDKAPADPATPPAHSNGSPATPDAGVDPTAGSNPPPSAVGPTPDPVVPAPTPEPPDPAPAPEEPATEEPATEEPAPEPTAEPSKPRGRSASSSAAVTAQQMGPATGLPAPALEQRRGATEAPGQSGGLDTTDGAELAVDEAPAPLADEAPPTS